jgi:hypothetical protein
MAAKQVTAKTFEIATNHVGPDAFVRAAERSEACPLETSQFECPRITDNASSYFYL